MNSNGITERPKYVCPNCGSASTGVVALPLDRAFIGCEVEEEYANIGNSRLSEITPACGNHFAAAYSVTDDFQKQPA